MRSQHQEGVGAEIARLRVERGWSQRELAKVVGLDQSAVSRIEAGRRRLSAAELHQFAGVFHVSADTLLTGAAEGQPAGRGWSSPAVTSRSLPSGAGAGAAGERELLDAIARARTPAGAADPGAAAAEERRASRPPAVEAATQDLREEPSAARWTLAAPSAAEQAARPPDLGAGARPTPSAAGNPPGPASAPPARPRAAAPSPLREDFAGALWADGDAADESVAASRQAPPPAMGSAVRAGGRPEPPSAAAAARIADEDWAAEVAGVVRDWFELRRLAAEPGPAHLWSTGQTADGRPAQAARPWQPVIPAPGSGDVLYDRVARFWRSELHVDPDDGPLPDLVPLFEDGLGIQIVVARIQGISQTVTATTGLVSDPRPVAATVVSDDVPFVFVNAARPVVLQRFALVHSFAHLALGHGDVVDESIGWSRANPREAAANDFAEEFLAPVRAVERWYGRRGDLPRSPGLHTLLELANAFGISAWAALFRSRAAGRLNPKQFTALRGRMRGLEWQLLPRQAFLGGLKDTLAHLTPAEVLPVGSFGPPAVLRVPACMRAWALALVQDGRLSLEDAAAMLRLRTAALADELDRLGLE